MQCDIIIAADNAKFGQPEIKLGVIPGIGGTQRLTRAVGKAKAMDMILTGRMMDAAEAERSGLVARVVPAASLMDEAMKVAETIAAMSLPSVLAAKEAINRAFESHARRRRALRAPRVPLAVRDRGSEGRHGGLRREAPAEVSRTGEYFRRTRIRHAVPNDALRLATSYADAGVAAPCRRPCSRASEETRVMRCAGTHRRLRRAASAVPALATTAVFELPPCRGSGPAPSSAAAPENPSGGAGSSVDRRCSCARSQSRSRCRRPAPADRRCRPA